MLKTQSILKPKYQYKEVIQCATCHCQHSNKHEQACHLFLNRDCMADKTTDKWRRQWPLPDLSMSTTAKSLLWSPDNVSYWMLLEANKLDHDRQNRIEEKFISDITLSQKLKMAGRI